LRIKVDVFEIFMVLNDKSPPWSNVRLIPGLIITRPVIFTLALMSIGREGEPEYVLCKLKVALGSRVNDD
jgi:hypothetical protein